MPDYVNVVDATIRAEVAAELLAAITSNAADSRHEAGCLQFDVLLERDAPLRMALYEVYADADAFGAHQQTAHHQRYFHLAHDLLSARRKTAYSRLPGPPAKPLTQPPTMTVSLIVTAQVQPENRDRLLSALRQVASASLREEPGCLQFDILADQAEPEKLMLYEVYADEAAASAHQSTAHFRQFAQDGVPLFQSHALKSLRRVAP